MTFAKGQSGNPRGAIHRKRNRLTQRFIRDLDADFTKNGARAIEQMRVDDPVAYCQVVAKLLPKDIDISVTHGLSSSFVNALRIARSDQALPVVLDGAKSDPDPVESS